jgi:hypothetical protein
VIIFPITEDQTKHANEPVSAWKAVEEQQRQAAPGYWVVTQPSHAALAGELAAALNDDLFGRIDAAVAQAIALHDAGWSLDDAEQIQRLRTNPSEQPTSFMDAAPGRLLHAWTGSIETVQKVSKMGGYLVSRHFERISLRDDPKNRSQFDTFRSREKQRQEKLKASFEIDEVSLERLVDALQFCDLLSLYLCCGSAEPVRFENPNLSLRRSGEEYKIDPSPFKKQQQFSFSALRHPQPEDRKGRSGATFYINL